MFIQSLSFLASLDPEKTVTKLFHLLKNLSGKPIRGDNSKSYGPLVIISVRSVEAPIDYVSTKFQLSISRSNRENCDEKITELRNDRMTE